MSEIPSEVRCRHTADVGFGREQAGVHQGTYPQGYAEDGRMKRFIKKLMKVSDHNLRSIMILCVMVLGLTISLTTEPTFASVMAGFVSATGITMWNIAQI